MVRCGTKALDLQLEVIHRVGLICGAGEVVERVLDVVAQGGEQAGGDSVALAPNTWRALWQTASKPGPACPFAAVPIFSEARQGGDGGAVIGCEAREGDSCCVEAGLISASAPRSDVSPSDCCFLIGSGGIRNKHTLSTMESVYFILTLNT